MALNVERVLDPPDDVIYRITISGDQEKLDLLAEEASRAIFVDNPDWREEDTWEELDLGQRLMLLGMQARKNLRLKALGYYSYTTLAATEAALQTGDERYGSE